MIMKNKYERMTKEEKKKIYEEFKKEKEEFTKKMERMLLFCKIGIIYFIIAVLYDFILTQNIVMGIVDSVLLLFCIAMLIKTNNTKIDFLNDYAIARDKKHKQEVVKKYKKN